MLSKLCPKCKRVISQALMYCEDCAEIVDKKRKEFAKEYKKQYGKEYNKKYNLKRDGKYVSFYNSREWIALRAIKLMHTDYLCEECKGKGLITLGAEVHHIKPIQTDEGWDERLEYNNLQLLCISCHNHKHNRFMGGTN